jgi:hypothetical protein
MISEINDNKDSYDVDDSTILRIRHWVSMFMLFGAATVKRLKIEHPALTINDQFDNTVTALTYFVKVVVNSNEWKFISSPVTSG